MRKKNKRYMKLYSILFTAGLVFSLSGCGNGNEVENSTEATVQTVAEAYDDSSDGGHAIVADGETAEYSNVAVTKTGEADGDEADFYGENAAIFATNGATLTLDEITVDTDGTHDVSTLNLYLTESSTFNGSINNSGDAGDVYVELSEDAVWKLTGDSYISSLTCDADSIDLNGYKLYVDGKEYTSGTASSGTSVEANISESSGHGGGEKPDGEPPSGEKPDGEPPSKPD